MSFGLYQDVLKRINEAVKVAKEKKFGLLTFALDKLTLGRTLKLQAQYSGTKDFSQASACLNQAVVGLRKAGQEPEYCIQRPG